MKKLVMIWLAILVVSLLLPSAAAAEWEHVVTPYLWTTGLDGTTSIDGNEIEIDASFSDLVEHLEGAFSIHYEGRTESWGIVFDFMWAGIGPSAEAPLPEPLPPLEIDMSVDLFLIEGLGFYRFNDRFQVIFGARYNQLDLGVEATLGDVLGAGFDASFDWVDPLVGFRFFAPIGSRGTFVFRGDVGGFGVGSDLAINVSTGLTFEVGKKGNKLVYVAYRILDTDYEDLPTFTYDVQTSGLGVGFGFRF